MANNPLISYQDLQHLQLWDRNYRLGDVQAIRKSIEQFGFLGIIRVWKDSIILAGNHATLALRSMLEDNLPVPHGIEPGENGEWFVPCLDASHLSLSSAEAFAIADNHLQDIGSEDTARLLPILQQLASSAPLELLASGYSPQDITAMRADLDGLSTAMPIEDLEKGNYRMNDNVAKGGNFLHIVMTFDDVGLFERAMARTGINSRAKALALICETYLNSD